MNIRRVLGIVSTTAIFGLLGIGNASAAITPFLSAGTTCGGANSASFSTGGAAVKVTLCVTTTTESLCGASYGFQSAVGESDRFRISARSLAGSNFTDPNVTDAGLGLPTPISINNPATASDFGATAAAAVSPGANQLLATFDIP